MRWASLTTKQQDTGERLLFKPRPLPKMLLLSTCPAVAWQAPERSRQSRCVERLLLLSVCLSVVVAVVDGCASASDGLYPVVGPIACKHQLALDLIGAALHSSRSGTPERSQESKRDSERHLSGLQFSLS